MLKYIKTSLYVALGFSILIPGIQLFVSVGKASNPEFNLTVMEAFISSLPNTTAILVGIVLVLVGGAIIVKIMNGGIE